MKISVGDVVRTRHGEAKIVSIDEVLHGEKYGHETHEAYIGSRNSLLRTKFVVDMDNGHWVYATGIEEKVNG
jgi:hypothetical protein